MTLHVSHKKLLVAAFVGFVVFSGNVSGQDSAYRTKIEQKVQDIESKLPNIITASRSLLKNKNFNTRDFLTKVFGNSISTSTFMEINKALDTFFSLKSKKNMPVIYADQFVKIETILHELSKKPSLQNIHFSPSSSFQTQTLYKALRKVEKTIKELFCQGFFNGLKGFGRSLLDTNIPFIYKPMAEEKMRNRLIKQCKVVELLQGKLMIQQAYMQKVVKNLKKFLKRKVSNFRPLKRKWIRFANTFKNTRLNTAEQWRDGVCDQVKTDVANLENEMRNCIRYVGGHRVLYDNFADDTVAFMSILNQTINYLYTVYDGKVPSQDSNVVLGAQTAKAAGIAMVIATLTTGPVGFFACIGVGAYLGTETGRIEHLIGEIKKTHSHFFMMTYLFSAANVLIDKMSKQADSLKDLIQKCNKLGKRFVGQEKAHVALCNQLKELKTVKKYEDDKLKQQQTNTELSRDIKRGKDTNKILAGKYNVLQTSQKDQSKKLETLRNNDKKKTEQLETQDKKLETQDKKLKTLRNNDKKKTEQLETQNKVNEAQKNLNANLKNENQTQGKKLEGLQKENTTQNEQLNTQRFINATLLKLMSITSKNLNRVLPQREQEKFESDLLKALPSSCQNPSFLRVLNLGRRNNNTLDGKKETKQKIRKKEDEKGKK